MNKKMVSLCLITITALSNQPLHAAESKENAARVSKTWWDVKSLQGKVIPATMAKCDELLAEADTPEFQAITQASVARLLRAMEHKPTTEAQARESGEAIADYAVTLMQLLGVVSVSSVKALCEKQQEIDNLNEEIVGLKAALLAAGALPQPLSESRALVVSAKLSASASPNKALITLTQRAHAKNGAANPTIKSAPLLLTYTAKQKSGWCSKLCGSKYTKE